VNIQQIKNNCGDCKNTTRWAEVRSDFDCTKYTNYRIIGIGREFVLVMSASGTAFKVSPECIRRVW
jgi:hypothetical protein